MMQSQTLGGAVGVILLVWYVFWRIDFVRNLMRRAGLGQHRGTKP